MTNVIILTMAKKWIIIKLLQYQSLKRRIKMKYKRMISLICALVSVFGITSYSASYQEISPIAAESAETSGEVTFTAIGQTSQITLSNTTETPTWYSDNTGVATVDSNGKITAAGEGTCTIYAVFSTQMLSFAVTVKPAEEQTDIMVGSIELSSENQAVVLTINGVDTSKAVWSTSDAAVAEVDSTGTVKATGAGSCTVTASVDGKNYIVSVTSSYVPEVTTRPTQVILGEMTISNEAPGGTITLSGVPDDAVIEWSSTDESVATVDAKGVVTAVGSGSCQITAKINGTSYIMNVTSTYSPVKEPEITAETTVIGAIGGTLKLSVSNTDEQPEWISTDVTKATVDANGEVTGTGAGEVTIIAKLSGKILSIVITVNEAQVYGDADLNGEVTINDAVNVMSAVANPEKYSLTAQGADNADVNSRGDGISNMDALAIQKYCAQVLQSLPES
jgi:uncharacterized protein YjdB